MKREVVMSIRMDENERRMLRQLAERNGLTVSSWIRLQIHREARRYGIEEKVEVLMKEVSRDATTRTLDK